MKLPFYSSLLLAFLFTTQTIAQTSIDWQKNLGTERDDNALRLLNDKDGNIIVLGTETHKDITGEFRQYMVAIKLDADGNEIWKTYHDIAHETFSAQGDFSFGESFFTTEWEQDLIVIVTQLYDKLILYKLLNETGGFWSYDYIPSPKLEILPGNEKIFATEMCSVIPSCYGPDSLVVQKLKAEPDSLFNFIDWTFETKQDLRITPIQGHYDIDVNDLATDAEGNTYGLIQIERWNFQFCTDCNDAFVDAWSMIYHWNADGELIKRRQLNITRAVVSDMRFLRMNNEEMVIRINDINTAGTALQTSIFYVDKDLNVDEQFVLDRHYNHLQVDANGNIYGLVNVHDPADPNIKGESDVYVAKYDPSGIRLWESYYGGTGFDFPKGLALTTDGGVAFLANSQSTDFDIANPLGFTDMWLVKLTEGSTAVKDEKPIDFEVTPNPATDIINIQAALNSGHFKIYDMKGSRVEAGVLSGISTSVTINALPAGLYHVVVTAEDGVNGVRKFAKL